MEIFEAAFQVLWADVDANNHFKNTAYLDYAAQTRFLYNAAHGFPPAAFMEHGIGPVILEDKVVYRRELRFLDQFKVQFLTAGQNSDGSRFVIANPIFTADGKLSADIRSNGLWLDLNTRKPVVPPPALKAAMDSLAHTEDYAPLA